MELKDVIHYYLGQNVVYENKIYSLRSINEHSIKTGSNGCFIFIDADDCHWVHLKDIQLLIRPLASMTEEEQIFICSMHMPKGWIGEYLLKATKDDWAMRIVDIEGNYKSLYVRADRLSPALFNHLIKLGFDLFGLIESGQAIDATKKNNP